MNDGYSSDDGNDIRNGGDIHNGDDDDDDVMSRCYDCNG